jgi:hypothetical protein
MVAVVRGIPVFLVVISFIAVAGWVADQTLSDIRKIRRRRRQARRLD